MNPVQNVHGAVFLHDNVFRLEITMTQLYMLGGAVQPGEKIVAVDRVQFLNLRDLPRHFVF